MRRIVMVASTALLGLAALAGIAWYSGILDRVLVHQFVHQPQRENLARQLDMPAGYAGRREPDFSPFESWIEQLSEARALELDALLDGANIVQIQHFFEGGRLSSEELVLYYVRRIQKYDETLHSVSELDPGAIEVARRLDVQRARGGVLGPMHGIPILLKDNIATAGPLHTTAGAKALERLRADRDAFLVLRLREAGAVVLGKTALSEWANYMSSHLPDGFSSVGGQVRNPYGKFDVSGSSSGSAVAVAANFATAAIGTETSGSLISPASQNSVVTIKPSVGLVSRHGIIPMVNMQDTAGPMTRNVTDAAILLDVLSGEDASDPATFPTPRPEVSYRSALDAFLETTKAPVRSLAEVIAFNAEDPETRAPFGQDLLIGAQESRTTDAEYRERRTQSAVRARQRIDGMLADYDLDVLVAIGMPFYVNYPAAGYPAVSIPSGYRVSGEPVGLTFIGGFLEERKLIRAAFAFEQRVRARRAPELAPR